MKRLRELVAVLSALFEAAGRNVEAAIADVYGLSPPRRMSWTDVVSAAGLTPLPGSDGAVWGAGSLRVELSAYGDERISGTRVRIYGPTISTEVTMRPENKQDAAAFAREIVVGDPELDAAAWVEGPPALVRSLLDPATRLAMTGLLQGRLERGQATPFAAEGRLERGVLTVDVPQFAGDSHLSSVLLPPTRPRLDASGRLCASGSEQLPAVLHLLLAIAFRLQTPGDVARRLADNLTTEPAGGVRHQCLATLAREHPDHPATREALLAARDDPDAEVRLRAGVLLGPEGRDTVLAVATGEGADDATTARAVAALGPSLSCGEAQEILHGALRTRREGTARACLRALGSRGGADAIATLAKVLVVERALRRQAQPGLAVAAAEALGETRDVAAEPPLLAALESPSAVLRLGVARALGRVGSSAAVLPLKELEEGDRSCRAAARQAIAEILSRLAGAEPGQLSLAGDGPGRLSLAEGEEGRLSLALSSRSVVPRGEGSAIAASASEPRQPGDGRPAGTER